MNSASQQEILNSAIALMLISNDDAALITELLYYLKNLLDQPEDYPNLISQRLKAFEHEKSNNRYFRYLNGQGKPYTASGRLDWAAKDEYFRIQKSIDRLLDLNAQITSRLSIPDQSSKDLFAVITLVKQLGELSAAIHQLKIDPVRYLEGSLTSRDLQLCFCWAGLEDENALKTSDLSIRVGFSETSRLLSARAAELAAIDYYETLGHSIVDISATQLDKTDDRWKDFDLLVDARPVDVKNARRSFSSRESYVEHCVPKFKLDRRSLAEVSIVGVLSDYHTAEEIEATETACLVLGEVRLSDIRQLCTWMRTRFGQILNLDGLWKDHYQPGWVFEYPRQHYLSRSAAIAMTGSILRQLKGFGIDSDIIPGWLLTLCEDKELVGSLALSDEKRRIVNDLHSLREHCGFTRPALFVYIMGSMLESIINSVPAEQAQKPLKELLIMRDADQNPLSLLGLMDTQGYMVSLMNILMRVQNESIGQGIKFAAFKLTHPSILRGQMSNGAWLTLVAYCGGWRTVPARVKCGATPLFFGQHEACCSCGYLVCDQCGYCSHLCELVLNRQRIIATRSDTPEE